MEIKAVGIIDAGSTNGEKTSETKLWWRQKKNLHSSIIMEPDKQVGEDVCENSILWVRGEQEVKPSAIGPIEQQVIKLTPLEHEVTIAIAEAIDDRKRIIRLTSTVAKRICERHEGKRIASVVADVYRIIPQEGPDGSCREMR